LIALDKATPNNPFFSQAHLHAGGQFHYFIMRLAAFQVIIYQVAATENSPIAFLACAFYLLYCKNNSNDT